MLQSILDTGPSTSQLDSTINNDEIPNPESCIHFDDSRFRSTNGESPEMKRSLSCRTRLRPSTSRTNRQSFYNTSFNILLFTLFTLLCSLPVCLAASKASSVSGFKHDSSVLATFTDTFENKDVELEKMVINSLDICVFLII